MPGTGGGTPNFGSTFGQPPNNISPTSLFGNPSTFTAGANTQIGDYDTIMKGYANLANNQGSFNVTPQVVGQPQANQSAGVAQPVNIDPSLIGSQPNVAAPQVSNPNSVTPGSVSPGTVDPTLANYSTSKDVTGSLADLSNMATTGGFTDQNIADIRARDISPTRSIYANAQRNVDQSRALGGGYSPGANATQASMARDESNQISDINTAANAGIAQNVTANKLAGGQAYAGAAAGEAARGQQAGQFNAGVTNQIGLANRDASLAGQEFNTQTGLAGQEFNVGAKSAQEQFNASTAAAVAEANANRNLQVGQNNAGIINQNNQNNANRNVQVGTTNAEMLNQIDEANAQRSLGVSTDNANRNLSASVGNANRNIGAATGALSGMSSLYGTTPALTNTFGNQVVQAGQLDQNQQQINQQQQRNMYQYGYGVS